MKCIRLIKRGNIQLEKNAAIPVGTQINDGLVKVLRSGICSTDMEIVKGYSGFTGIMGHEFVGKVERITSPDQENHSGIQIGSRVVGEINIPCNSCSMCKLGGIAKRNHCLDRKVLGILKKNGTFADYITLPLSNLYLVPENVSDKQATFVEPLAAAFRIVEQLTFLPNLNVAIIGDGKLGLLIAEVLSLQTFGRLVLFGRHENKMSLVGKDSNRSAGVGTPLTTMVTNRETTFSEFENVFDVVIEACGAAEGLEIAARITRPLGTIVMKTTIADNKSPLNRAIFVVKEQILLGSRCGNFPMALNALSEGTINVDKYFEKEFSLEDYEMAFQAASTKGAMKMQFVLNNV